MIINKNKTKIIPILNKSLKEIYFNKDYDVITLFSLLKENEQTSVTKKFIVKSKLEGEVDVYEGNFNFDNKSIENVKYLYTFNNSLRTSIDEKTKELFPMPSFNGQSYDTSTNEGKYKRYITNLTKNIYIFINDSVKNSIFKNKFTIAELFSYIEQNKDKYFENFKNCITNKNEFIINNKYNDDDIAINISFLNKNFSIKLNFNDNDIPILYNDDMLLLYNHLIDFNKTREEKIFNFETESEKYQQQIKLIANEYTNDSDTVILNILEKNDFNYSVIRIKPNNIEDVVNTLNDSNHPLNFTKKYSGTGKGNMSSSKGRGELAVHLMFQTTNVCTSIEPDAIIHTKSGDLLKCSIKACGYTKDVPANSGSAIKENNEFMNAFPVKNKKFNIKNLYEILFNIIYTKLNLVDNNIDFEMFKIFFNSYFSTSIEINKDQIQIDNNINSIDVDDISNKYNLLKQSILKGHEAKYVLIIDDNNKFICVDTDDLNDIKSKIRLNELSSLSNRNYQFYLNSNGKSITDNYLNDFNTMRNNSNIGVTERLVSYILYFLTIESSKINEIFNEYKPTKEAIELHEKIYNYVSEIKDFIKKFNSNRFDNNIQKVKKFTGTIMHHLNNLCNYIIPQKHRSNYIRINTIYEIEKLNNLDSNIIKIINIAKQYLNFTSSDIEKMTEREIKSKTALMKKYLLEMFEIISKNKDEQNTSNEEDKEETSSEPQTENVGYKRKGMSLREVFKNLY